MFAGSVQEGQATHQRESSCCRGDRSIAEFPRRHRTHPSQTEADTDPRDSQGKVVVALGKREALLRLAENFLDNAIAEFVHTKFTK